VAGQVNAAGAEGRVANGEWRVANGEWSMEPLAIRHSPFHNPKIAFAMMFFWISFEPP
jgi:hypothetical protein